MNKRSINVTGTTFLHNLERTFPGCTQLKGQPCWTRYGLKYFCASPLLSSGWPVLSEVLDEGICLQGGWGTARRVCVWVSHRDLFSGILTGTDAPSGFKGNSKRASDRRPIPSVSVCVCVWGLHTTLREGGPAGQHKYWQPDQPIKSDPPLNPPSQPTSTMPCKRPPPLLIYANGNTD